jgi:hypothetical protein
MTATFPPPTAASEDLITRNLGLARQQAWKFHRRTGQPYDDLEAIAFVGLIRGCRRYDPERVNASTGRPYALSTIVVPFVAGEILHHFRDRGHAIKFPSRWREAWGKVQRLMADPNLSTQDVAEQSGLSVAEISEMLAAMTGTSNLDDLHGADACSAPEPEISRIAPLQALVRQAWANLHQGDRGTLLSWWGNPRRLAHPIGPLQQFHGRLKALLRGQTLSQVLQLSLAIAVPVVTPDPKPPRHRRNRKALEAAAGQLGLLVG